MYWKRLNALLSPAEKRIFERLDSPEKIQDYLDPLGVNFEMSGETYMSPRRVLKAKKAHCFEGALLAAAILAYHGQKPLLLDFRTIPAEDDHVVALFYRNGRWGAISKTNHYMLRYRDAVYESVRELAMSYFHEYFLRTGKKSMLAYSAPFDLSTYAPERWVVAEKDLDWLAEAIDNSKHFPIAPKKNMRRLRKASDVEQKALKVHGQKPPKGYKES
ncbi:MAG TPA: hypothetical protein VMH91_03455 [Candidatus Paceibacterota bacterium]|nr:hypothetical protein [Candidatus Paceibacterota bacterium]